MTSFSKIRFAAVGLLAVVIWPLVSSCTGTAEPLDTVLPANFHVLDVGKAYRSAQPTADNLKTAIADYGIRTVVNLRGENTGKDWYDAEAAACQETGVTLANHAMSAQSLPSAELLKAIITTLQTAEYPILIHCNGGADRTGAVSAIYRMLILHDDRTAALTELSPEFLHFRQFTPCMDTLAESYEPGDAWLAQYAATVDQMVCTP